MRGGVGGGARVEGSAFPAISAVHHPLLEGKSVFLPLVLSPNVLYLEKKEQTLTNAYCFPTKNATSASAPTQMSAPLPGCPGVGVAGPGHSATAPGITRCEHRWSPRTGPPLEVAWFLRNRFSAISRRRSISSSKLFCPPLPPPTPLPATHKHTHTTHLFGKCLLRVLVVFNPLQPRGL